MSRVVIKDKRIAKMAKGEDFTGAAGIIETGGWRAGKMISRLKKSSVERLISKSKAQNVASQAAMRAGSTITRGKQVAERASRLKGIRKGPPTDQWSQLEKLLEEGRRNRETLSPRARKGLGKLMDKLKGKPKKEGK